MNDWQRKPIGAVCDVIAGQSPKGADCNENGIGVAFHQGKKEFGAKHIGPARRWTTSVTREARPPDVLMSVRAPVGPVNFAIERICIGRGLAAIRARSGLDPKFLFYALLAAQGRISGTDGAVFPSISKKQIEEIEIPFPSLSEQERVVAILDGAFAGIDSAATNAEKNTANSFELFDSILEDRCTPHDGWMSQELQKDVRFLDYRGRTPKKTETGLRLITAKNVRMGFIRNEPQEFVDPATYESWMTRGIPRLGDVLFTTEAPLGLVAQLDTEERVVFAQRVITLVPDRSRIDPMMLHYVLRSPEVQRRIHENATGATASGIKASLLKKIRIALPNSLDEQRQLAQELAEAEDRCRTLRETQRRKVVEYASLRSSILSQAISGSLGKADDGVGKALTEAGL